MTNWTAPPQVAYTADLVLFAEMEESSASVLLIKRTHEPFADQWALPGGYVETGQGEEGEAAALRETEEETGIAVDPTGGEVLLVGVYGPGNRDPRGLVLSAAFTATLPAAVEPRAGDDAKEARWVPLSELNLRQLAFDHGRIVREALMVAHTSTLADFR